MSQNDGCCCPPPEQKDRGFFAGLLYGLVPHTFCILFIVLSIVGATAASSIVQRFLYIPYIFETMVALSFLFATISAVFYLRRNGLLSAAGAKAKWKYLTVMYTTTVSINLLFFWVIFPALANVDFQQPATLAAASGAALGSNPGTSQFEASAPGTVTLQVNIPCPGHAPLITGELKRLDGITGVRYQGRNLFQVTYDPAKLTVDRILALEVFKAFKAEVQS